MSETASRRIPRMRTAARIIDELKALDPGTEVTVYWVRQLIKSGGVPVVHAGNKSLVNLDDVLDLLCMGSDQQESESNNMGGIRRIDAILPR